MKKISPKLYLCSLIATLAIFAYLYLFAFKAQLGSAVIGEWWVKSALDYKRHYAQSIDEEKILILGGSNALFGINSEIIEQFTAKPVANISTHASLELDFLYFLLEETVNEGDIVVMPLEYDYYSREDELTSWFANNIRAWGKEMYLDKVSTIDYLDFVASFPKAYLWTGLLASSKNGKVPSANKVISEVQWRNREGRSAKFKDYKHSSLTLRGDFLSFNNIKPSISEYINGTGDDFGTANIRLNDYFLREFRRIEALIEQKKATLILTWPASIRNHLFTLEDPNHQARIDRFIKLLESEDIEISCEPGLFNYDYRLFFDSKYHLNVQGAKIRSIALGDCLRSIINKKQSASLGYELATKKLIELENSVLKARQTN